VQGILAQIDFFQYLQRLKKFPPSANPFRRFDKYFIEQEFMRDTFATTLWPYPRIISYGT
jgi:hypothetical protein